MEGYDVTGLEGHPHPHEFVAEVTAASFKEACSKAIMEWLLRVHNNSAGEAKKAYDENYDENELSYWGCRLFDNEKDAAELFG